SRSDEDERAPDGLRGVRGSLDRLDRLTVPRELPRPEADDRPSRLQREGDLRQRAELAADRDHDVGRPDDERDSPGRMPIEVPPADAHPLAAASITPPSPPQTSTAPASASRRPISSAQAASRSIATPAPQTATYGRSVISNPSSPAPPEHRREQRDRTGLVERL